MNANKLLDPLTDQELETLTGCYFTQGRWYANYSRERIIIESGIGEIIAVVAQSQVGPGKAQANAHLIIAAPRLYRALEALVVSAYDPEEGDCLICGAQCAWGGGPHEGDCEVEAAARILALAGGEMR